MAQISLGKLLPNLKVTLGHEEKCSEEKDEDLSEIEEGEDVEIVRSWMDSLQNPKIYKNKSGGFMTGIDLTSENNSERLDKRAERFGLEKEEISVAPNINSLYESMDINIENRNSAKMKNVRLDALHVRGINELNTNDIFHYFRDYGPASVEWINDYTCNVVWLDEASCARALLGMSKPLPPSTKADTVKDPNTPDVEEATENHEKEQEKSSDLSADDEVKDSMDVDEDPQVKSSTSESTVDLDIPIPPGHWRLGVPHPKAKTILLRFATKDDKKLPGAEKRSVYYQKYGNPNYGGLKGLISSSRKRKVQAAVNRQVIEKKFGSRTTKSPPPRDDIESDEPVLKSSKPKQPRMRMYADDEESRSKNIRVRNNFPEKPRSVHSRLGSKYTKDDLAHLGRYYGKSDRDDNPRDLEDDDYEEELEAFRSNSRPSQWDRRDRGRRRNPRDLENDYEDELEAFRSNSQPSQRDRRDRDRRRNQSPENQVDLRTKLKRLRRDNPKEHDRIHSIKKQSRTDSISKHRSPLCADNDSLSDESV